MAATLMAATGQRQVPDREPAAGVTAIGLAVAIHRPAERRFVTFDFGIPI